MAKLRALAPEALIIGFKLLDGVSHERLISVGRELLKNNDCDYVLANDYQTVAAENHTGYLIDSLGNETEYVGKEAIAKGIVEVITGGEGI